MSRTDTDSETTVTSQTDEKTAAATAADKSTEDKNTEDKNTEDTTAESPATTAESAAKGEAASADKDEAKDEAASADEDKDEAAGTRRSPVLPMVLAALVVIAAVGVGVLGWTALSRGNVERDQNAALEAAKADVAQVLSYDAKTVDADIARSRKLISGDFAARFDQLADLVIVPASKQQGLVTKAEVVRAALIDPGPDAQPDHVQALLFVKQSTSSNAQPQPTVGVNQVRATMTRGEGGQWLISNVEPL